MKFYSENFSDSQIKKYIREKELLAFRNSLAKFKVYLLGRKFIWYTDNNSLKWAKSLKTSEDKIARILGEVSQFDYEIQIKRSGDLKVTDYLSRVKNINAIKMTQGNFANLQNDDKLLRLIKNFVKIRRWPNNLKMSEELSYWKKFRNFLEIDPNDCLIFRKSGQNKLVVPESLRMELLEYYHDFSGHPGSDNTIYTLGSYYIWFDMGQEIRDYVRNCDLCQRQKPNLKPKVPPQCKTDTPNGPFEKISADLTGPLPVTNRDNKYILVVNDHFSKKIHTRPLSCKHSWEVLRAFKEIIYGNPRLPKIVLTDNGGEFQAQFDTFLTKKGIKHVWSSPYHPQSNGVTERMNATLKNRLQPYKNERDWDLILPEITQLINLCPNDTTKMSPFLVETGIKGDHPYNPVDNNLNTEANLDQIRESIVFRQEREKSKRVNEYLNDKFRPYELNQKVLIKARQGTDKFVGPFIIIKVLSNGRAFVIRDENGKELVRRSEELKQYYDNRKKTENQESVESDENEEFEYIFLRRNLEVNRNFSNSFFAQTPPTTTSPSTSPSQPSSTSSSQPTELSGTPTNSPPSTPTPTTPTPNSPTESHVSLQIENYVQLSNQRLLNYTDLNKLDLSGISTQVIANPDSENSDSLSSGNSPSGNQESDNFENSDTDLSELTDDEDNNTGAAREMSWMERESTAEDLFTSPEMLTSEALKNHILNDIYTKCDFLYKNHNMLCFVYKNHNMYPLCFVLYNKHNMYTFFYTNHNMYPL